MDQVSHVGGQRGKATASHKGGPTTYAELWADRARYKQPIGRRRLPGGGRILKWTRRFTVLLRTRMQLDWKADIASSILPSFGLIWTRFEGDISCTRW